MRDGQRQWEGLQVVWLWLFFPLPLDWHYFIFKSSLILLGLSQDCHFPVVFCLLVPGSPAGGTLPWGPKATPLIGSAPGWVVTCIIPYHTAKHSRNIPFLFLVMWPIPLFSLKRTIHYVRYFRLSGKFGKPQRLFCPP